MWLCLLVPSMLDLCSPPYHCHWVRRVTKLEAVFKQLGSKASCIYPERGPSSWTTLSFNFPIYEISRFDDLLRSLSAIKCCDLAVLWPFEVYDHTESFAELLNAYIYTDHGPNHILGVGTVARVKDVTWHGEGSISFTQTSPRYQGANRALSVLRLRKSVTVKSSAENAGAQEKWRQSRHNMYSHSWGMWFQ